MNLFRNLDRKDWVMVAAGFVALLSVLSMLMVQPASPKPAPLPDDSDQAEITWSEPTVEVILSPGETASRRVSFTTSEELEDVVLEISPEISGFLRIRPGRFEEVEDDERRRVRLLFSVPEGTALGTYEGTIALRELDDDDEGDEDDDEGDDEDDGKNGIAGPNGQIVPQTLKVVVNVWEHFSDESIGITFKIPPDFIIEELAPDSRPDLIAGKFVSAFGQPAPVTFAAYKNETGLSPENWFNTQLRGTEFSTRFGEIPINGVDSMGHVVVNGFDAFEVTGTVKDSIHKRLFFSASDRIIEFRTSYPFHVAEPETVSQILSTVIVR